MLKRTLSITLSSLILLTFVSYSNNNNVNKEPSTNETPIEEKVPEETTPPPVTSFDAFGKTYTSSKDITSFEKSTDIYNINAPYVEGEYKEVDFAKDLLTSYVNQSDEVYNHLVSFDTNAKDGITPITEEDKNNLKSDLESLRSQMHMENGEPMVLSLDTVTFDGTNSKTNTGIVLKMRVAISKVGAYAVPFNSYTVTLFEQDGKLVAHLF